MRWGLVLALASVLTSQERVDAKLEIRDTSGIPRTPFASGGRMSTLFFVTTDCPISNQYAREIQRVCRDYENRTNCYLVYVDPGLTPAQIARHVADFGHAGYPVIHDMRHELVKAAGATVTPEAAVIREGMVAYRGRIDNAYATWGKRRAIVTEKDLRSALDALALGGAAVPPRTKPVGCFIPPLDLNKSP
ncbi:MAG: hypothetical protein K2X35_10655 [Bryobacteraceae bacterium]|nr:hypothetical protein [Bryobacteraceae bacterium]